MHIHTYKLPLDIKLIYIFMLNLDLLHRPKVRNQCYIRFCENSRNKVASANTHSIFIVQRKL